MARYLKQVYFEPLTALKLLDEELSKHTGFPWAQRKLELNKTVGEFDETHRTIFNHMKKYYLAIKKLVPRDKQIPKFFDAYPIPENSNVQEYAKMMAFRPVELDSRHGETFRKNNKSYYRGL